MAGSLPATIDFYEKHKSDRFEILAIHDKSVKSFDELDRHLGPMSEKHWKGRALPFPVILDTTGAIVRRFQLRGFPTTLLIDPEGRLVSGSVGLGMLQDALDGKLKVAESRPAAAPETRGA